MPSLYFPKFPNDELPDDDQVFHQNSPSELDLDSLLEFDRDCPGELGLEEVELTLMIPSTPLSLPPGATTYLTHDRVSFSFCHRMAGEELPIQIDVVTPEELVGYARMSCFEEGVLTLGDIRLDPTHRRRGMGSTLLHHIIALAREHNLQCIHGFVVERDLRDTPYLLDMASLAPSQPMRIERNPSTKTP